MTFADVRVTDVEELGPFSYRWPDAEEEFESGWDFTLHVGGNTYAMRHGIGGRVVYGRYRVHTVTWLNGTPTVEGVEADDYPTTQSLISVLRRPDKKLVRSQTDVPREYAGFDIVEHRHEIDAKWSRHSIAVKIPEDSLRAWALHAVLRDRLRKTTPDTSRAVAPSPASPPPLPVPPTLERKAVADALLAHGEALAQALGGARTQFTQNKDANELIYSDPFAFLVAVICDQGIVAERAWAIPYELKIRLGHLDPNRMAHDREAVRTAFATPPKLHRFVNDVAGWVVDAARLVLERYDGNAENIWNDRPPAKALRARFDAFPGVGQKKAAMAVEILARDVHVPLTDFSGSDIAYDIHVRRVFLRTDLAEHDSVAEMVAIARALHPSRPGELDNPAWDIGRRWCHAREAECASCPLLGACPRLVDRGSRVKGI